MKVIDFQKRLDLKEQLKGMSYENLVKLAEEDPIIPVEGAKEGMSENVSYSATIQNYCTLVNTQPDTHFLEVPGIIPMQNKARSNAAYWLTILNRRVRAVYTQVKDFAITYGSMDERDIDNLLADIYTESGKIYFREFMYMFRDYAGSFQLESTNLSISLVDFSQNLSSELRDFEYIKTTANRICSSESGAIPTLQQELSILDNRIKQLNILIGLDVALSVLNNMYIAVKRLFRFFSGGGLSAPDSRHLEERRQKLQRYQQVLVEIDRIRALCAAVNTLAHDFDQLIKTNSEAGSALTSMISTWQDIANGFGSIATSAEGVVSEELVFLIRLKLRAALKNAEDLKRMAEERESYGILQVVPDEEIGRILRLPRSWVGRAVNGEVFNEFITSSRGLGRYDKGRRGWASRDRQFICSLHR